jgi:putative transposase
MKNHILPFADEDAKIRLMFEDEGGFGRINKPTSCWCPRKIRPIVPCHHIREYRYAYGAVEPQTGESCFLVMPYANTNCMNLFLRELSKTFVKDYILLAADRASWHRSKTLEMPDNIRIFPLLPYTPEMNPIEQIWKELRKLGFKNEMFPSLDKVVDRLCDTINSLTCETVQSITGRDWILSVV